MNAKLSDICKVLATHAVSMDSPNAPKFCATFTDKEHEWGFAVYKESYERFQTEDWYRNIDGYVSIKNVRCFLDNALIAKVEFEVCRPNGDRCGEDGVFTVSDFVALMGDCKGMACEINYSTGDQDIKNHLKPMNSVKFPNHIVTDVYFDCAFAKSEEMETGSAKMYIGAKVG